MLDKIFEYDPSKYGLQGQKFIRLLMQGLVAHTDVILQVLTKYSNRKLLIKKYHYEMFKEIEGKIEYIYLPENILFNNLLPFLANIIFIYQWSKANKDGKIICDGLCFTLLASTIIASIFNKVHVCTFVTDLPSLTNPQFMTGIKGVVKKYWAYVWEWLISLSNSFILLTPAMNDVINHTNKPFVIIEGLVDLTEETRNTDHSENLICLYAGSLNKIYGIDKLVYAFLRNKHTNYELHIYGGGDFEDELRNICKKNEKIKFFGWKSNDEIINILPRVSLLINPRPTDKEFTLYSFPSKIMEYMLSGTPVLTTKLGCIPDDYYDYLYFFEDESIDGMSLTIDSVLSIPWQIRLKKGKMTQQFVLKNKNNIVQSKKILSMLEGINNFV